MSIFRRSQTLKEKRKKGQTCIAVAFGRDVSQPHILTKEEILGRRDTRRVAWQTALACTRNTRVHKWTGREGTSTEAAGRPMSSDASDTSLCTPQEPECPVREHNINVTSLSESLTQLILGRYTLTPSIKSMRFSLFPNYTTTIFFSRLHFLRNYVYYNP